ncbi:thermonuclease family protein [Novosphingobium taihuense]|uniref:Endonuclease YncB(Thermonuclease family) n=1 Tax=Novosphingobium taihuense TaxID=260085 RepID=A0A7W7A9I6_9SPHN|nr:thermonuclease family protein [Novosphingobium taihuense]MBB4612821.1 endonuclease YncB(thermonuclease family) [Novosphingobium taihuense]TWH80269.1 endonuclease YncB(thermonuclease family) [Novosphingobium taihuense]
MKKWTCLLAATLGFAAPLAIPDGSFASSPLPDTARARFDVCAPGPRVTCVVDGDTFWLEGTKIRIADINTPETSQPGCAAEAELGKRATRRLVELLNAGPFALEANGRETDRYGRALRVVTRKGRSLGAILEAEGLAEHWKGRRSDWCA